MIFRMLKAITVGARIAKDMPRRANEKAEIALELGRAPVGSVMRFRQEATKEQILSAPPTAEELARVELRLGGSLPPPLMELYSISDGVRESEEPFMLQSVVRAADLKVAASYDQPISTRAKQDWETWGNAQGEPLAIRVSDLSWEGLAGHLVLTELPVTAFDSQLVICVRGDQPRAVYLSEDVGPLKQGSVVAVENLRGTHFESLAHWLACDVAELRVRSHQEVLGGKA